MHPDIFKSYFTDGTIAQSDSSRPMGVPSEEDKEEMKQKQIENQKKYEANPDFGYQPPVPPRSNKTPGSSDPNIEQPQQPVSGTRTPININTPGSTKTDDAEQ